MKSKENLLDEYQEQKLLRIEKNGMWLAFWGLFAAILFQNVTSTGETTGESIIFLMLAVYVGATSVKSGLWDRKWKATPKVNLIASLIAGLSMGSLYFMISYIQHDKIYGAVATSIIMFISVFILVWSALTITSTLYKKRVAQLENRAGDDSHIQQTK